MALLLLITVLFLSTFSCAEVTKPKVHKCCPFGQFVGIANKSPKACLDGNYDFGGIPLFNYGEATGRNINSTYDVTPDRFGKEEQFHLEARNSFRMAKQGLNFYLNEDATLALEAPNSYLRWRKIENAYFCVDHFMSSKKKISAQHWVVTDTNDKVEKTDDNFLTAAMFVSSFFLLLVLIVYILLPDLRNLSGLILMAYVISLLTALLLLAVLRVKQHSSNVCYSLTLLVYYSFLASFCWMNVMSYDIWWTFRGYAKARQIHRRGEPFKYAMYSIYSWGVPLAMTIMMSTIDKQDLRHKPWFVKPNLESSGCFIEGGEKLLYLYCPMLILICTNWLFFLMTAFNIWRLSRGTSVLDSAAAGTPAAHRSNRHRFLVYLKLTIVMGLNWVLEVISFLVPGFSVWYITDFYNILIGVSIFFIFVCKKKILRKLTKVYIKYKSSGRWYTSNSTRGVSTSSEGSSQGCTESETLKVCANPKGPGYVVSNNF